jgi:hypothetical protein
MGRLHRDGWVRLRQRVRLLTQKESDDDIDAKRWRPSIGEPATCHGEKRVGFGWDPIRGSYQIQRPERSQTNLIVRRNGHIKIYPCFLARFGGVSGGNKTQGCRVSSHTAMAGAGKFGSAKLPMATVTCPGKPSFSQKTVEPHVEQK